jgi:hypothetical protein
MTVTLTPQTVLSMLIMDDMHQPSKEQTQELIASEEEYDMKEFDRVEMLMKKHYCIKQKKNGVKISTAVKVKKDEPHKELYRQKNKEIVAVKKLKNKNKKVYKCNHKLRHLERSDRSDELKICV